MNQENKTITGNIPDWLNRFGIPLGLLFMAVQGIRTISHADFWTHLATGRWMAGQGVPRVDPLTIVSEGDAWVHASWLYDALLYRLWNIGGAGLVTLLHVALVVVAFYLLARAVRPHTSATAIGVALLLSAWLLAPRFEVRPSLLCLIFPALYVFILSTPRRSWIPFATLLPAQILWANLDASFVWGPLFALCFAAQAYFQPADLEQKTSNAIRLGVLTVLLLLVSMVNPYGPAIFSAVLATWTAPVVRDWISPISMHFASTWSRHMVTLALIIGALGLLSRKDRLPIGITSIAVIGAFLVVHSLPVHIAIFSLFAFPFFCLSLHALGELVRDRLAKPLAGRQSLVQQGMAGLFLLFLVLSVFWVVTNRSFTRTGSLSSFGLGVAADVYPEAAQTLIGRPDFPARFLNLPVDGGYLSWRNPERRVFIDQRSELHQQDLYHVLAQGLLGQTQAWATVLSEWDPEAIVLNNTWPYSSDIIRHLQTQHSWETAYFDGTTTILVLGTSTHASILEMKERLLQESLQVLEQRRRDYRRKLGGIVRPPIPNALVGAAAVFQARGYYREAAACHELLVLGAPRMLSAQLNLGICQTRLERYEEAVATLTQAIERLPRDSNPWVSAHMYMGISQVGLSRYTHAIRHLNVVVEAHPTNILAWLWLSRAYNGAGQATDARQALERARALDPDSTAAFQQTR